MTASLACVFPNCAAYGRAACSTTSGCCERCGRPLGGARIGPEPGYRIEAWLDSGYYADVFRVADLRSGARLAAKLYADEPPKRQAAQREVAALQRLSHPRLPAFEACFDAGPWRCVIMELVEGTNLRQMVEESGPLTVAGAVAMAIEACDVLSYIAAQGWTYRDLHPRNLHLGTPKGLMLLDMDNSRPPGAPAVPGGRAGYRAPEFEWGGQVTPACDVFGLAGCVYFALVGDDPPEPPGPLPALRGRLASPPLADLLDACREADPARRPSAEAVRAAFQSLAAPDGLARPRHEP